MNNNYKCLAGTELSGTGKALSPDRGYREGSTSKVLSPERGYREGSTGKVLSPERVLGTEMDSRYQELDSQCRG